MHVLQVGIVRKGRSIQGVICYLEEDPVSVAKAGQTNNCKTALE